MTTTLKHIVPAIAAMLVFTACNKWLDVQPSNQISDKDLFENADGVRMALNGVYQNASLPDLYGKQLTWGLNSALAQDYVSTSIPAELQRIADRKFTDPAAKPLLSRVWAAAYTNIANCNKIIATIEQKDSSFFPLKNVERNLVWGEALAMRALLHFEVLRLFAPAPANGGGQFVPYQTSYPSVIGAPLPGTEVIKRIVADLQQAQSLVAQNDTIVNKGAMNGKLQSLLLGNSSGLTGGLFFNFRMNRLNYVAIHLLLARVYLYAGDRDNAKKEAEYLYKDYSPTGRLKWWAFTTEANSKGVNRYSKLADDIVMAFYDPNLITAIKAYKGTSSTFALSDVPTWFPTTERDYRMNLVDPGNISAKWLETTSVAQYVPQQTQIMPVLRFSEVYYIYCECLYEEGNTGDALKILNEIRYARGKTNTFSDASRTAFYTELFQEYRREFVAEGQTVFAYKRLNRTMTVGTKVTPVDNSFVAPVPDGEKIY